MSPRIHAGVSHNVKPGIQNAYNIILSFHGYTYNMTCSDDNCQPPRNIRKSEILKSYTLSPREDLLRRNTRALQFYMSSYFQLYRMDFRMIAIFCYILLLARLPGFVNSEVYSNNCSLRPLTYIRNTIKNAFSLYTSHRP